MHGFKPVTTAESIQVAILDELQQIRTLLEPSKAPDVPAASPEPPAVDEPPARPVAKKASSKRGGRREVRGD